MVMNIQVPNSLVIKCNGVDMKVKGEGGWFSLKLNFCNNLC